MGAHNIVVHVGAGQLLPIVFLYVGPETILPLTSALAAIVGIVLMLWHRIVGISRRIWQVITRKAIDEDSEGT